MASSNKEFKHESLQDRKSIVEYLHALSDGIEKGHIQFKNTDQEITMEPIGLLNLRVKAEHTGGKAKLMLRLEWKEKEGDKDDSTLLISSEK